MKNINQEPRTWTFCPDCFDKGDKIEGKLLTDLGGRSLDKLRFVEIGQVTVLEYECPVCEKKWKE